MDGRAKALTLIGIAAAAVAIAYLMVAAIGTSGGDGPGDQSAVAAISVAPEEAWGIKIKRVSLVAGGGLIDLRYEVVDVEKAKVALGPSAHGNHASTDTSILVVSPLLIDDGTQQAVTEAHLHQAGRSVQQRLTPELGVERFIFFQNTGGLIEKGDSLTLAIGQARVVGLVAQ